MTATTAALLLVVSASPDSTATLRARTIATRAAIGPDLIVGRAACHDLTWLLTERLQLVAIAHGTGVSTTRTLQGLHSDDRPWGLACLPDGTLWTLPSPRAVARIDSDGRVLERIAIRLPRLVLFAAGGRLLYQQLPFVPGAPILTTSPPRVPADVRTWPALIGRTGASREEMLSRNLANCGMADGPRVPCWFADEARIAVSDGTAVHSMSLPWIIARGAEREAPIWDVALLPSRKLWLLTASGAREGDEGRAGGHLFHLDERGAEIASRALVPRARVILAAAEHRCLVLGVHGEIIEVLED